MNNPKGIYIHVPFCVRKCFYCDFYSITESDYDNYVQSLIGEIKLRFDLFGEKPEIDTVFFGGGTPSLLLPKHYDTIFEAISKHATIQNNAEISIEANPGTQIASMMKDYQSTGINRLSIGVQSFDNSELKFLQRIHDAEAAIRTIENAVNTFGNVSLDLIYALPKQKINAWKKSLETAISLGVQHISAYTLIFEPDTPLFEQFEKGQIAPQDEDSSADFYETCSRDLLDAGLHHYEISNFAQPGYECRHNLKYWNCEEYFAFGPSAFGVLGNQRYGNIRNLKKYSEMIASGILPESETEILSPKILLEERIYMSLRAQGIDLQRFKNDFSIDILSKAKELLDKYITDGIVQIQSGRVVLTEAGFLLCDEIALQLIETV